MLLPKRVRPQRYYVWGAPGYVDGTTSRTPAAALLSAFGVPDHQFVEERVVFPRELLSSAAGAKGGPEGKLHSIPEEGRASGRQPPPGPKHNPHARPDNPGT